MNKSTITPLGSPGKTGGLPKGVIAVLIVSTLLLQGCSLTYYRMRSQIASGSSSKRQAVCPVKYSLSIKRYGALMTLDERAVPDGAYQFNKYVSATEEVFARNKCKAAFTEDPDEADFRIKVTASPALDSLPNEKLTLFSLGFIPSWGVQEKEFEFAFENTTSKMSLTYIIDRPVYNHIIFFPVFWLSFVGLEETDPYKKALINFIENSRTPAMGEKRKPRTKGA
jgi:hypothetical protein